MARVSDGAGVLSILLAPSNGGNRWELHGNNTYTGLTTISNVGMNHFQIDYEYDGVLGQGVALVAVMIPPP